MQRLIDKIKGRSFQKRIRADTSLIDVENRTIPFIIVSKNNAGERYDWWEGRVFIEELDVKGADLTQLRTFFKDHVPSVDTAIGRVENLRIDGEEIKCDVIFGSDDNSQTVFKKYVEGILTDVSIGYTVDDSNSQLGKIKSANQGQFSIEDRDSNTPYLKKVWVVSTVDYYLSD